MAVLQLPAEHEMSVTGKSLLEAPWLSHARAAGKPWGHGGEPPPCPEQNPPGLLLPQSQLGGHRPRDDGIAQRLRELPGKNSPSRVKQAMWDDAGD